MSFPQCLFYLKIIHLQKPYLLIRCYKTSLFLWSGNNTDINGVNKQNTHTHTKHSEKENTTQTLFLKGGGSSNYDKVRVCLPKDSFSSYRFTYIIYFPELRSAFASFYVALVLGDCIFNSMWQITNSMKEIVFTKLKPVIPRKSQQFYVCHRFIYFSKFDVVKVQQYIRTTFL